MLIASHVWDTVWYVENASLSTLMTTAQPDISTSVCIWDYGKAEIKWLGQGETINEI